MSITQDQLKKLAKNLAKLEIKNEEKMINDINSIISYIDKLNELDTSSVNPTISVVPNKNILREDEIVKDDTLTKELLKCSPQKVVSNMIAINSIMK